MEEYFTRSISVVKTIKSVLNRNRGRLATVESCTGGLLATALTELPGSSSFYQGGLSVYNDSLKKDMLGVTAEVLDKEGAVSEKAVKLMAENIKSLMGTQHSLSISGIAGPGYDGSSKNVGEIWCASSIYSETRSYSFNLEGSRKSIRYKAMYLGLVNLLGHIEDFYKKSYDLLY